MHDQEPAASDGDANHFNVTVTVTGASGATTDKIENINISGVGADDYPTSDADLAKLALVGGFTVNAAGRPVSTEVDTNAASEPPIGCPRRVGLVAPASTAAR